MKPIYSMFQQQKNIRSDYQILESDEYSSILAYADDGNINIYLPYASNFDKLTILKADTSNNQVIVHLKGNDTFEGSRSNYVLNSPYQLVEFTTDNESIWYAVSTYSSGSSGGGSVSAHASTHLSGGSDPIDVQNLRANGLAANLLLLTNANGGWTTISSASVGGISQVGGGSTYVVGSSASGDTINTCTHLDDGSGDAFRQALASASANGGGMVYLRRGSYSIGGSSGTTTVPSNVTVSGEDPDTVLALPTSGQMYSLVLSSDSVLNNLSVKHNSFPTGNITTGAGNRFVQMEASSLAFNVRFSCLANGASVGFYPGFWSLIRMAQEHAKIVLCTINTYSSVALGAGSEAIAAQAVGTYNEIINTRFGSSANSSLLDVAAEIGEGSWNRLVNCDIYNSRVMGVRMVGVGGTVQRTGVHNSRIIVSSGTGIGSLFVGATVFENTKITDCEINCGASATSGISLIAGGAGEDFDGVAIQNCILKGSSAGTGIILNETGAGQITNVSDSLNRITDFSSSRSGTITGPSSSVGNY